MDHDPDEPEALAEEPGTGPTADAEAAMSPRAKLQARLDKARRERDEYKRQVHELRVVLLARPPGAGAGAGGAPPGKVLVDQKDYEELRLAKRDLVRLLRRLGRPPLGWLVRRQSGYRKLRERWLREG